MIIAFHCLDVFSPSCCCGETERILKEIHVIKKFPTASRNNCWSKFANTHAPIRDASGRETSLTLLWSFETYSLNRSKESAPKITINIKNKVQQRIAALPEDQLFGTSFQIDEKADSTPNSFQVFGGADLNFILIYFILRCFHAEPQFWWMTSHIPGSYDITCWPLTTTTDNKESVVINARLFSVSFSRKSSTEVLM